MKAALTAIWLAACGGGGGGGSVALSDFGTQLPDTLCAKAFRCCTQTQLTVLFNSSTTLTTTAQCDAYLEGLIGGFAIPRYQASVAAGRVTYDGDAAGACLDSISGAACSVFDLDAVDTMAPPSCAGFLTAQVQPGGGCTQNYECTTGYCKGAVTTPTPMDGACTAAPTMGQTCDSTCASGLYCDFTTLTCQAKKADGAVCSLADECTSGGCVASICGLICNGP